MEPTPPDQGVRVETATVLFSDLVASTEHRVRLGEDGAEAQRRVHDALVQDAITSNRGVVVKHLGDGVMATFTSATSAVAGAVALQQAIDSANRRDDLDGVRIRIGISVGDVTFEGDDCFGLPVVEAQRLETSAEPGTIRCAELVMHLARGRGDHEFSDLGELSLKGLAGPVRACEVGWIPVAEAVATLDCVLSPVLTQGRGLPFCGRADVFAEVVSAWERAAAGGFEMVLLAGEPGVGKTRVASELAGCIEGAVVLAGRCDEDVQAPFQPFAAALEWYVDHCVGVGPGRDGLSAAGLGRYPGDLVRLVPDLAQRVPDLPPPLEADPEAERLRLFQAVASWLGFDEAGRPMLLVLDDLQWADRPSLLLLRHLLVERPSGLMVLCTYRDTDVDRVHPLSAVLADLRRDEAVTRLSLDGLDPEGVRELLVRAGGHDLDEAGSAFAEAVHRETSGNPFFVGEVLRHLAETGALVERDGRWTSALSAGDAAIPEGVREVVGRRLSRLGGDAEQVLRAAAVVGHEFDVDVLIAVGAGDEDGVLDALDVAAAAHLVDELGVGTYRFAHALVRETLHSEMSSTRRARQHRRVAEALEARHHDDLGPVLEELAAHWAEATAGGAQTRAIELAMRAGERALDQGAHEHAVLWFDRALEMIDDEPDLAATQRRILVLLAHAEVYADGRDHQRTAMRAARSAIDAGDVAAAHAALTVNSRVGWDETQPAAPELVAILREALAVLPGLGDGQRAELLNQLALELIFVGDIAGRAEVLGQLNQMLPDLSVQDRGRIIAAGTSDFAGIDLESQRMVDASLREASAIEGDVRRRARFLESIIFVGIIRGERSAVEADLDELARFVDETGVTKDHTHALARSMLATVSGDLATAEAACAEMAAILESRSLPEALILQSAALLAIGRERGDTAWMLDVWPAASAQLPPASTVNVALAFVRFLNGQHDEALAALDAVDLAEIPNDGGWPICVSFLAEIAASLGSVEQARGLRALLDNKSGLFLLTGGIVLGAADRILALIDDRLGDHASADQFFASAVELHERFGARAWVARTQLDWASARLARGEAAQVPDLLDDAEAAIGDLDLAESRQRLAGIRTRLSG